MSELSSMDKAEGQICQQNGGIKGDSLLVLVNKDPLQQLLHDWVPNDLVDIPPALMITDKSGKQRKGRVRSMVLEAYVELLEDAAKVDLELKIRSAYRSYDLQCRLFQRWVNEKGLEHAKRYSAIPGRSQHQLGTTIDITSARLEYELSSDNADEIEYTWLTQNAHRYGLVLSYPKGEEELTGYAFEPWHYRFIGRAAATEMLEKKMLLESYLLACQQHLDGFVCPDLFAPSDSQNGAP